MKALSILVFTDTSIRVNASRLLVEQSVELSRQYGTSFDGDGRLLESANNAIEASFELLKLPYPPSPWSPICYPISAHD
jgi:hypothetical protein